MYHPHTKTMIVVCFSVAVINTMVHSCLLMHIKLAHCFVINVRSQQKHNTIVNSQILLFFII